MDPTLFILPTVGILLTGYYAYRVWSKKRNTKDINIKMPSTRRKDLFYGYYGSVGTQFEETVDHVNLYWVSQFEGPDQYIPDMAQGKMPVVLDVSLQLYERPAGSKKSVLRPDAEQRLRDLFNQLSAAGVLEFVKVLYPIDEPNSTLKDIVDLQRGLVIIENVSNEFRVLNNVKLGVIYTGESGFPYMELFDWIGFDDYPKKSSIFASYGEYAKLKKKLQPHQKTMIVPGGSYLQDPAPFIAFAQSNAEVAAIIPFVWFDEHADSVGVPGIRSTKMKEAYIAAGKYSINR